MSRDAECRLSIERLGQRAGALTGFTGRVVAALAHLAGAWSIADDSNRPGVEAAIYTLLNSCRSLCEPHSNSRPLAHEVLADLLDREALRRLGIDP